MKKSLLPLCATLLLCACNPSSDVGSDYDNQSEKYWEQAAQADEQLSTMKAQQDMSDRLLKRQESQLDRWDAILDRHERVLAAMEKQYEIDN